MIDLDDCYMLGRNFHLNKFKGLFDERVSQKSDDESDEDFEKRQNIRIKEVDSIKSNLFITIDGTIMGVRRCVVDPFFNDKDVENVRWSRKNIPNKLLIQNSDDLYKLLAAVVPLDETVCY
jgi:hypothetical protein